MVEPALFKSGMRRLAAGVSIITTVADGTRFGLVATSVCSVSLEPPSLLVCVNHAASSHDAIQKAGFFCVNLLRKDDNDTARRFSSPEYRDIRFEDGRWGTLDTGAPALVDALASFDCEISKVITVSSHTVFIGNVTAVELWSKDVVPLIYFDGRYNAAETQIDRA